MRFGSVVRVLPTVTLVAALALSVLLALQLRTVRGELARERVRGHTPPLGLPVPTFEGLTYAGDSTTVGRSTGGQILFFFSTKCAYCREVMPTWNLIASRTRRDAPQVIITGLTLDSLRPLRSYAEQEPIDFDIVLLPDSTIPLLYRVEVVPLTLVISPDGHVALSRAGVLSPAATDSVIAAATRQERLVRSSSP